MDDQAELARPLQFLGILASETGEYEIAREQLQASLHIFRAIGDSWEIAWTLSHLGYCLSKLEAGERSEAKRRLQESLTLYQQLGGKQGIAIVLNHLGYVTFQLGDSEEAQHLLLESLALRREIGYPRGIAVTLNNLGHVAGATENYLACQRYYDESLEISLRIGAFPLALDALGGLAIPLWQQGQTELARQLFTLACHHPARSQETYQRVQQFVRQLGISIEMLPSMPNHHEPHFEQLVQQALAAKREQEPDFKAEALDSRPTPASTLPYS
jgi:tetratricopeptide (TPR) repeat protein